MKVKVCVEYTIDLPITKKEAFRKYPDCLDPVAALSLDTIDDMGFNTLIQGTTPEIRDVVIYDD